MKLKLSVLMNEQSQHDEIMEQIKLKTEKCQTVLRSLDKADLVEMSKYNNPSPNFIPCMRILCLLFNLETDPKNGSKYDPDGVFPTIKRKFAQSKVFLKSLEDFEACRIPSDKVEQIDTLVNASKLAVGQLLFTSRCLSILANWELLTLERCKLQNQIFAINEDLEQRKLSIKSLTGQIEEKENELEQVEEEIDVMLQTPTVEWVMED